MQGLACSRGLSYLEMFEVHIHHGFTSGEILGARIRNGARFFIHCHGLHFGSAKLFPKQKRTDLDRGLGSPGVSATNTGSKQRFAETSAVPGQGISVAGQSNLYNSFIVDVLPANDDATDLTERISARK
jgi:hypothetical protein